MGQQESEYILDLIAKSSIYDLVIVSLLILPMLLGAWSSVLDTFLINRTNHKKILLIILLVVYTFGIASSKYHGNKKQIIQIQMDQLTGYLCSLPGGSSKSNKTIEKHLQGFTDDVINNLVAAYPKLVSRQKFKGGEQGVAVTCVSSSTQVEPNTP